MKRGVNKRNRRRSGLHSLSGWAARLLAIAGVIVCVAGLYAADNGTISGVIRDAGGAVVAGVKVTASRADGSIRWETSTDSKGAYSFTNLPPGKYSVLAEVAGFQPARYSGVDLSKDKTLEYDFQLVSGAATEIAELGAAPQAAKKPAKELDLASLLTGKWSTDAVATATAQSKSGGLGASLLGNAVNQGARAVPGSAGGFGGGSRSGIAVGTGSGAGFGRSSAGGGVVTGTPAPRVRIDNIQISNGIATVIPADALARNGASGIAENPFVSVTESQLSTFSIDVDTASYANVRRFLTQNQRPPRDLVRIEELVNYFSYDYPTGSGSDPITGNVEVAAAPWNSEHRLVRVGVRAKAVARSEKAANLVFLIDVSGSMNSPERLPLMKSGLKMLVDRLTESDLVSIVTYAGAAGVALQPTNGDRKETILKAIEDLRPEGSTNGGAGIQTAYDMAIANFLPGGVNRVVLVTDGDFNVGITNQSDLVKLIEGKAKSSVFLTVLGVGNNFKDALLEKLADKGNGNYAFIDTLNEARKVLLEQMDATLVTVAKDVKIQVEFNPERVASYRLIGYEDRALTASDFNNDVKDAGEMGSGHTVTAFYEVVLRSVIDSDRRVNAEPRFEGIGVDPLRYRQVNAPGSPISDELLDLKIRYKEPEGSASRLIEVPLVDRGGTFARASQDFRFAAAVAAFGMILRDSPHRGAATWSMVRSIASDSKGADRSGYRAEFIRMAERAAETWRASLR